MTSLTTETIASRSKQAPAMDKIMTKLKLWEQREHLVLRLGAKDEKEAAEIAKRFFWKAGKADIVSILSGLEAIHGKTYRSVKVDGRPIPSYADIPEALYQRGATHAELDEWDRIMHETVYMAGGRFQPLPSHPEALQAFQKARLECDPLRAVAAIIRKAESAPPVITDEELTAAARFGFWDDLVTELKRKAYQLMPKEVKDRIFSQFKGLQAMEATREYYLTLNQ